MSTFKRKSGNNQKGYSSIKRAKHYRTNRFRQSRILESEIGSEQINKRKMMKLKFKIQQYQTDAVENVVKVFNGQPNKGLAEYVVDKGKTYEKDNGKLIEVKNIHFEEDSTGYKNGDIVLTKDELLKNIHQVQTENNIRLSNEVVDKLGHCQLDVEMETGTGKTYVYIKTMFELNKLYGWTKFIVVVPSVAIREGVKKSFDITVDHFMEFYGKKARYFIYNSNNLNQIDTFSQSGDISVMIINTQAFNTSLKEGAKMLLPASFTPYVMSLAAVDQLMLYPLIIRSSFLMNRKRWAEQRHKLL